MDQVEHSQRAHALLSASGADRWLNCTPSPRLEEQFAEKASSYAQEGTLAHEFADIRLRLASHQITQEQHNIIEGDLMASPFYSKEMLNEVDKYVDFVMETYAEARMRTDGAVLSVEEKIDLTEYIEDGFGTNDAVILADGILDVCDLKYGKGVKVSAVDNSQLKLYGLGALFFHELSYDIHTVRLNIIQPRLNHTSQWSIPADDLRNWGEKTVKPLAKKAYAGKGVQKAGDWCRWCKAKATCATLAARVNKLAAKDFDDVHFLTDDQVIEVFKNLSMISMFTEALKSYVLEEAKKGKRWPGFKLVRGSSRRKWTDEEAVKQALEEEMFEEHEYVTTKLKGIGDIEKLVTKANFKEVLGHLVVKPEGVPMLVEASDSRPAIGIESAKEDFKD